MTELTKDTKYNFNHGEEVETAPGLKNTVRKKWIYKNTLKKYFSKARKAIILGFHYEVEHAVKIKIYTEDENYVEYFTHSSDLRKILPKEKEYIKESFDIDNLIV